MNEVVFIGTSDAFGAGGRRQAAVLVRGERGTFLFDCGMTTNTGLAELGIERDEIDTILISHFHGDHFGGIPLLLLGALYEDRRTRPLHIAGPPDVERRVWKLAEAAGHPIDEQEWTFDIRFTELPAGSEQEIGPALASSFETRHQLESHPHGYRVSTGKATVVYSGDTGWFDELPRLAAGADLFICECTFRNRELDFHLSLEQLIERRAEFDNEHMILTHLGSEMSAERGKLPIRTADDGLVLEL